MTRLVKHEIVLTADVAPAENAANYVNHVAFVYVDDDGVKRDKYMLPLESWRDMGSPTTITLTVVPGNALNEE